MQFIQIAISTQLRHHYTVLCVQNVSKDSQNYGQLHVEQGGEKRRGGGGAMLSETRGGGGEERDKWE